MAPGVRGRDLLLGGGTAIDTTAFAGCDLLSTEPTDKPKEKSGPKARAAPMLAVRVEKGELSPLKQRLPPELIVVEPTDRIETRMDAKPCQYFIEEG